MTTAAGVPFPSFPFAPSLVGAVPVGAVSAFAGPIHAPEGGQDSSIAESAGAATSPLEAMGWMVCDGRTLACTNYPELFSVLGYLYGGKDGCFNIPDYRGFLPPLPVGTSVAPAGELAADALPATAPGESHGTRPANVSVSYIIKFTYGPAALRAR